MILDLRSWTRCQLVASGVETAPDIDEHLLASAIDPCAVHRLEALSDVATLRELRVGVVPCLVLHGEGRLPRLRPLPRTGLDAAGWSRLVQPPTADDPGAEAERPALLRERGDSAADDVGTLTHCLSHELRGPIRNSARLIDLVLSTATLEPQTRATLERVRTGSRRLAEQVDGLVQFLRLAHANVGPTRLDISILCTQLLDELVETQPSDRRVLRIEPDMQMCGDLQLVALALRQMLDNACKFSLRAATPEIHVSLHTAGAFDVLAVSDNGAGFSSVHAQALFRPFERIHLQSEFPGNGIGLALVRRVAERHGGWAWADVAHPGWTRFMLALPAAPGPRASS